VFGLEDDVIGQQHSDRLARPAPQDSVANALRVRLQNDLDRNWKLVARQELAQLAFRGRHDDDRNVKARTLGFSERVGYERFSAERQKLFGANETLRRESSAQPSRRNDHLHDRDFNRRVHELISLETRL
jgi:hypothetical protein